MTPSKTSKNDKPNKISPGKSPLSKLSPGKPSLNELSMAKRNPSTFRLSPTPLPKTTHLTPSTRKPSASAAPQTTQPRKPSATQKPSHLTPLERKLSLPAQPRKPSATSKPASPPEVTQTSKLLPRKLSATPPHKPLATFKQPSPPKPDWKAPPGKPCAPSPSFSSSFSPSPTHIPLPVFASSPRQEVAASPGSNLRVEKRTGGFCTPVPAPRRRRSGVAKTKTSSPLVCEVNGEGDIPKGYGEEVENKKIKGGEVKGSGLGLGFKDPFSPTLGSGSGSVIEPISGSDFISGSSMAKSAIPRAKSIVDTLSPTLPTSTRPRIYTPTSTTTTPTFTTAFTTVATKHKQPQQGEGVSQEEEETPKRDSLSPIWPTSAITSFKPTTIPTPSLISSTSPRTHFSKLDLLAKHHRHRHLSPSSTLPPSPASTHPYTGNTHITPSCTVGALTHRLRCGHLVLTERAKVCGANCERALRDVQEEHGGGRRRAGEVYAGIGGKDETGWERVWREKIEKKRQQAEKGFVANVRDLDAEWVCPCCGNGKGRRCVAVLDGEFQ